MFIIIITLACNSPHWISFRNNTHGSRNFVSNAEVSLLLFQLSDQDTPYLPRRVDMGASTWAAKIVAISDRSLGTICHRHLEILSDELVQLGLYLDLGSGAFFRIDVTH